MATAYQTKLWELLGKVVEYADAEAQRIYGGGAKAAGEAKAASGDVMGALQGILAGIPAPDPKSAALNPKQFRFSFMAAMLIVYAYSLGYTVTLGDAWSRPQHKNDEGGPAHKANSLHFDRLAIDINLFKGGKLLMSTEDHKPLGLFWESIGGAWGGRFNDGNHYSLEHQGRR